MKYFSAREVSQQIDVKPVTLRAWSKSLEDNGYKIFRDPQAGRMYSESDISALRRWKEFMDKGLKWEQAAKLILEAFGDGIATDAKASQPSIATEDALSEMQSHIDSLMQFNRELVRRLDERDQQLEERDKLFEESLKRLLEPVRLQLEASQEEKQRLETEREALKNDILQALEEQSKEFKKRDQEREEFIEQSIKRRDEQLMQTLRAMQENTQREIAATMETKKRKRFLGLF